MSTKTKNFLLTTLSVIVASFIPAVIFGKWIGAVIFILCHTLIRPQYDLQYHHIVPMVCRSITSYVVFLGISFLLPLNLSLVSAVPINYFIGWLGENFAKKDKYEIALKLIKEKSVYEMEENELVDYCLGKGIKGDKLEFVIMILIYDMKYAEISQKLGYSIDTLKDWSPICKKKLGISSWKNENL